MPFLLSFFLRLRVYSHTDTQDVRRVAMDFSCKSYEMTFPVMHLGWVGSILGCSTTLFGQ